MSRAARLCDGQPSGGLCAVSFGEPPVRIHGLQKSSIPSVLLETMTAAASASQLSAAAPIGAVRMSPAPPRRRKGSSTLSQSTGNSGSFAWAVGMPAAAGRFLF